MKIKAFAKLNLTLDICGKREDGYHLLDSVMISVDPADIITLKKSDKIDVKCSDPALCGEGNIGYKAADAFFKTAGIAAGASIYIEKHIPEAAGLGGGSSDAAAVIRGLDRLYGTDFSSDKLREIGLSVGADVPFCIDGGCARVGGIGEIVKPLSPLNDLYFVIAKNGVKSSTGDMYGILDRRENQIKANTPDMLDAIASGNATEIIRNVGNVFISVAGLYGMDKIFVDTDPLAVSLSGSGPSVFAVYSNSDAAKKAQRYVSERGINCFYAEPHSAGIVFE